MQTVDWSQFSTEKSHRVLDLGCGEGRHAIHAWLQGASVFGVDLNFSDLQCARKKQRELREMQSGAMREVPADSRLRLCCADSLQLPFANHFFDRIVCSEVLEHIHDFKSALLEIRRVLKPQGLLCISVPRYFPEWLCWTLSHEYPRTPGGHVRIFRSRVLRRHVENLHFECYARHWAHALHSPYWWLRCLFWSRGENFAPLRLWHRFLVWDMMKRPLFSRALEALLNPLIGKSVVFYFRHQEMRT